MKMFTVKKNIECRILTREFNIYF